MLLIKKRVTPVVKEKVHLNKKPGGLTKGLLKVVRKLLVNKSSNIFVRLAIQLFLTLIKTKMSDRTHEIQRSINID